jgi:hypothetical protein
LDRLASRLGLQAGHVFLLAWLVAWVLVFSFLLLHDEASSASGALGVRGNKITYDGSPVQAAGGPHTLLRVLNATNP